MNDRELLELAAKAAGLEFEKDISEEFGLLCYGEDESGRFAETWNPLTDDGDALRLAVKMEFLDIDPLLVNLCMAEHESHSLEKCAAIRRAIVFAASEIGRGMK